MSRQKAIDAARARFEAEVEDGSGNPRDQLMDVLLKHGFSRAVGTILDYAHTAKAFLYSAEIDAEAEDELADLRQRAARMEGQITNLTIARDAAERAKLSYAEENDRLRAHNEQLGDIILNLVRSATSLTNALNRQLVDPLGGHGG